MNNDIYNWYMANIKALDNLYRCQISWDRTNLKWIMIEYFQLPPCFNFRMTSLLIGTPGDQLWMVDGFKFYVKKRLSRTDGKPTNRLHDDDFYNEHRDKGWSKLSYHFFIFRPNLNYPSNGDNIPKLCSSLYNFLGNEDGII